MKYFKKILLINIIVMINVILSEDIPVYDSIINKKLNYQLEFENISAGNAFIEISEDIYQNIKTLKIKSKIRTNRFIDFFYKIRDEININMNYDDFSLIEVTNNIKEGKYKKKHHAKVNIKSMEIIINDESQPISNKVYSPLSIIFSLRNKLLQNSNTYNYNIYSSGKLKNIDISVIGKENIKTPYGIYETIILSPKSIDGKSALENKGDMKIWLTDDYRRLPLKIEIKLKHGSISLLLDNIES